jgi:hypothetical protein
MRKILFTTLLLTLGLLFFLQTGCKKTDTTTQVILNVSVSDGINGDPLAGSYTYDENAVVEYNYILKDRYENLAVTLDGEPVETSGTITMAENHALIASADAIPGDFLLSVATSEGVIGTPDRGNFYYLAGETQDYSYSLEDGYTNMRVQLNGEDMPDSGTILFDRAHTLYVFADKYYEIRGEWEFLEAYEDGSNFSVTLTFSGDNGVEGTVSDSDGGTGTFETLGPSLTFTIVYPEVTYEYIGLFSEEGSMSGTCKRITAENTYVGSWAASNDTSSTTTISSFLKKINKGDIK